MSKEFIKNISKMTWQLEIKLAKGVLQWKHKKEGNPLSDEEAEMLGTRLTYEANKIISRRGKELWAEIKKAYREGSTEDDS